MRYEKGDRRIFHVVVENASVPFFPFFENILVRATNWVGDAVMSLPAIRAIRERFAHAELTVVARPWVAGVYARETSIDRILPYTARGWQEQAWRRFAGDNAISHSSRNRRYSA